MKKIIICHTKGRIIGIATSEKQKEEIINAYFSDAHSRRAPAEAVEFTYVKPNILFPMSRGAVTGVTHRALIF